ncbi:MAG: AtpZ/AtpI family protein [Candidatus Eremiobacteraeota bacterium]|nr:AtpZ/AtpI family protein [Candidatus Eremiobacteraeota bacterium]
MVIFIVLCMFLGLYLDDRLGTGHNLALLMTVVGMGVGGWWTYRRIIKNTLEDEEDDESNESTSTKKTFPLKSGLEAPPTLDDLNKTDGENEKYSEEK